MFSVKSTPVHPHVRGARGGARPSVGKTTGPSPRAWGSVAEPSELFGVGRSIPTCVGLGESRFESCSGSTVHPHVRGARLGEEASVVPE